LTRLLPGGFCSLMLADFGADVVKIADTGIGDYVRWSPRYYEGAEQSARSALFLALTRGKRSMRIDLKQDRRREVLLRLARGAEASETRPPRRRPAERAGGRGGRQQVGEGEAGCGGAARGRQRAASSETGDAGGAAAKEREERSSRR